MLNLDKILRKVQNPPAPQNWVRLLVPNDVSATAKKVANFAFGIPSFNYVVGSTMCHDRVRNHLNLDTALKACAKSGSPAGRDQNANFVRAFFAYDEIRRYSDSRYFESYSGYFPISREVKIPTKPTFTIIENRKQIPVVLCGWKTVPLDREQRRIVASVFDSGLFSFGAYRHSPGEIVFFPELQTQDGPVRSIEVWNRGDFQLLSTAEMRDILDLFSLAQEAAVPIIRDKWADKARKDSERSKDFEHDENQPNSQFELFAPSE